MSNKLNFSGSVRRLFKEGAWALGGQAAGAVVTLGGLRILTEMVPPSAYGKANLLVGLLTLGMNIAVAPTTNAELRLYPNYKRQGLSSQFIGLIRRHVLVGAVLVALALSVGLPFSQGMIGARATPYDIVLLCLLAAALSFKGVEINWLNAERNQVGQSLWMGLEPVAILLVSVVALTFSKSSAALIGGQMAGTAIILFAFLLFAGRPKATALSLSPAERGAARSQLIAYGAPFAVLAILGWLGNLGDRYVLSTQMGAAEVGIYAASFGLASRPILLIAGVINQVLRPILFEASAAADHRTRRRVTTLWLSLVFASGVATAALLAMFGTAVGAVFLARSFRPEAGAIMAWVASGYAVFSLDQAIQNQLMAQMRPWRLILPQAIGGLANIGLALWLIPLNGILGAAQANAFSFLVQFIVTIFMWLAIADRCSGAASFAPTK